VSAENVEVVRRVYEAINVGDWEAALRDTDPQFQVTYQRGPLAGTHQRDGARAVTEDYVEAFDDFVIEPEDLIEAGDHVVAMVVRRGKPKGGNVDMVVRNGHLWTLWDGKLLSMRSFPDPDEALEAAGLSE
jgi:ketosteroid isomerase-like protein